MPVVFGVNETLAGVGARGSVKPADVPALMQGVKELGASGIRMGSAWLFLEPQDNRFTWTDSDRAVAAAVDNGLDILYIINQRRGALLGYQSGSASGYGDLCRQIALRYGVNGFEFEGKFYPAPCVSKYQICNEVNSWSEFAPVSAGRYVEYLRAAFVNIMEVQPAATVVSAGLMGAVSDDANLPFIGRRTVSAPVFAREMYRAGAKDYFHGFGLNPYCTDGNFRPVAVEPDAHCFKNLEKVRDVMVANDDAAKLIWPTEWGHNTIQFPGEEQRDRIEAQWDIMQTYEASGVCAPSWIFAYRDWSQTSKVAENHWGVVEYNFEKKPAWFFLRELNPAPSTQFNGYGTLSATTVVKLSANFSGVGVLVGGPYDADADFTGSGTLSAVVKPVHITTAPFSGAGSLSAVPARQVKYQHTFTGSTKPTSLFTDFGQGYSVSSGVANNNSAPTVNDIYYSGGIYKFDQFSPDHYAEVERAGSFTAGDRSVMPIVRSNPEGTTWVGAVCRWGGSNSTRILTSIDGVVTARKSSTSAMVFAGEHLKLIADGDTYVVWRYDIWAKKWFKICTWVDVNNEYPGSSYLRTGFGFQHIYSNGQYSTTGIRDTWYGWDVRPTPISNVPAVPAFTGSGSLSATVLQSYSRAAAFTGSGSLAAQADEVGGNINRAASFTGAGVLSAVSRVKLSASFSGAGSLMASASGGEKDANFAGSGQLGCSVVVPVTFYSKGAGNSADASSTSWSHTIAASGTDTVVEVWVGLSLTNGAGTVAITATYGGVTMAQRALVKTGDGTGSSAVGVFYLFHPPGGAQTVAVSETGTSVCHRISGISIAYKNAANAAPSVFLGGSSDPATVTVPSTPGDMATAIIAADTLLGSTSHTERFSSRDYSGSSDAYGGIGDFVKVQDTPGGGDIDIDFEFDLGTVESWLTLGLTTQPARRVNANFGGVGGLTADVQLNQVALDADFTGEGSMVAVVKQSYSRTAQYTGTGVLSATADLVGGIPERDANYTGSGTLSATVTASYSRSAVFTGSGALSATVEVANDEFPYTFPFNLG